MHDITIEQISQLSLNRQRPLVICDVDEVVVHFTRDFEMFLKDRKLWLDLSSRSVNFAITRHQGTNIALTPAEGETIISQYFAERTRDMQDIEGAVQSLLQISHHATVLMLTNLPHEAGDDRRHNLAGLGLTFPVITNSGPKGPAIQKLASMVDAPVVFIDDSPGFIKSSFDSAPHVHLVHFVQDERFANTQPHLDFVSLRTDSWSAVLPHVLKLIAPAKI